MFKKSIREVVEVYPDLRESIVSKLIETLHDIKSSKVFRVSLWIIGEYALSIQEIDNSFTALRELIGDIPFVKDEV